MERKPVRIGTGLLVLLLLTQINLFGQAITGTLLGSVVDQSGAVVPNAEVTVTNLGTGVSNKMVTGSQGFYTFPTLSPGVYSVTVAAPGFKTMVAKGNIVQVEKSTRVDMTLSPGAVSQQITVTGQAPVVETTTSDLGTIIDQKQINNLPVNGRLFQTLMFLAPGTTPAAWGDQIENPAASGSPAVGGGGGGTYASVNGFAFQGNLYLVDGVLNVEPQNGYINIAPPFSVHRRNEDGDKRPDRRIRHLWRCRREPYHEERHQSVSRPTLRISPQHQSECIRLLQSPEPAVSLQPVWWGI
jgi:hypothetical protein